MAEVERDRGWGTEVETVVVTREVGESGEWGEEVRRWECERVLRVEEGRARGSMITVLSVGDLRRERERVKDLVTCEVQ